MKKASRHRSGNRIDGVEVYDRDQKRIEEHTAVASGMTVVIRRNDETVKSYTLSVIGDINGDTLDARTAILSTVNSSFVLEDWQKRSADLDENGSVSSGDVRSMLLSVVRP